MKAYLSIALGLFLFCVPFDAWSQRKLVGRKPLKNPIVLVHGATSHGSVLKVSLLNLGEYFKNIPKFLDAAGTPVYVAHLTTDSSIGERAAVLKNFLETELKGQMVNIVGHSLGGLDARYAASILKAGQIASITTVGTPHLGSPLADWAVDQMEKKTLWYWFFYGLGYDLKGRRFLKEISTENMQNVFNKKVLDVPGVKYFSVSTGAANSAVHRSIIFMFTSKWMESKNSPLLAQGHDGMVPVMSQLWGTAITGASLDHLGQINHHFMRYMDQQQEAYQMYSNIYDNLSQHGL